MKKQAVLKIIDYIKTHGRALEKARLSYLLGHDADESKILEVLTTYQNADGGFGHALEPDSFNPNSSPLQSFIATTLLREIAVSKKDPLVLSLITYFENTFDLNTQRWPRLIASNDLYPHAPWWHFSIEEPSFNPSASIAGFILSYANPLTKAFKYATLVAKAGFDYIIKTDHIEMHELRCLIDLILDAHPIFKHYQMYQDARDKIITRIDQTLEKESSKWFTSYCVKPTALIKIHPTFISNHYIDLLFEEFQEALNHRNPEGVFDITWSWSDYPNEFKLAKQMWKSILSFEYLYLMIQTDFITLKDF